MKKKLTFVLGGYPVISHTFLYNQIMAVIESNEYDVQIVIFKYEDQKIHKAYESLNNKIVLFPMAIGKSFVKRLKLIFGAFFTLLFSKPSVIFKSLDYTKYARNAINMNYLVMAKSFIKLDSDIIHCHFGTTGLTVADLRRIGVVKGALITSFHGMDITVFPKRYGVGFYKYLFNSPGLFTGNSNFIISKMIENGCPPDRIFKVPECLNINQFKYRTEIPPRKPVTILTVGRFVEKKGYEYSLRAVALLKEQGIDFEYQIIGEGPLLGSMKLLAKELNVSENVIFNGALKQDAVVTFYESAHIFLLPSVTAADGDTEGQGLVLQEAQAIGLPVVATLHNGFPDSIIDGVTGYLVPERDATALYEKLLLLCNDEAMCKKIGQKGRSFVEQSFDSKIVVETKLSNVYNRSIEGNE